MKITEQNMAQFLGRGIQIYLKNDDWAVNYKPMELIDGHTWIGYTSGGLKMKIHRDEIEMIRG